MKVLIYGQLFLIASVVGCNASPSGQTRSTQAEDDEERDEISGLSSFELNVVDESPGLIYGFELDYNLDEQSPDGVGVWYSDSSNYVVVALSDPESPHIVFGLQAGESYEEVLTYPGLATSGTITGRVEPGRLSVTIAEGQSLFYDFSSYRDINFESSFAKLKATEDAAVAVTEAPEISGSIIPESDGNLNLTSETVTICNAIQLKFADLPQPEEGFRHWLGLTEAGASATSHLYRFQYLDSTSGSAEISTRGLDVGTNYEIRIFLNWGETAAYNVYDSVEFSPGENADCTKPSLVDDSLTVAKGANLAVKFSTTTGNATNWVAIAKPTATPPNYLKFKSLPASNDGEVTIAALDLEPGSYVIRLFEDWDLTKEYFLMDEIPLTVTE